MTWNFMHDTPEGKFPGSPIGEAVSDFSAMPFQVKSGSQPGGRGLFLGLSISVLERVADLNTSVSVFFRIVFSSN